MATYTAHKVKIAAIVPAAGYGVRAALSHNKVLAPLCGRPLLSWTLRALLDATPLLSEINIKLQQVFVAAQSSEYSLIKPLIVSDASRVTLIEGGASRQQSVFNGAHAACDCLQVEYLLIHDAARPLVSPELIARVSRAASTHGAAIAALPASDTVKITDVENDARFITSTPDRKSIYLAQTPQVFRRDIFMEAFERAARDGFEGTDCASLIERAGHRVAIVEGEASNFKVTYADDFRRAESLLRTSGRVD